MTKKIGKSSLSLIVFLALISQSLNSWAQEKDLPRMPLKAYKNVSPVTVKIICNRGEKTGSGVIVGITPYGRALILTACHVVAKEVWTGFRKRVRILRKSGGKNSQRSTTFARKYYHGFC